MWVSSCTSIICRTDKLQTWLHFVGLYVISLQNLIHLEINLWKNNRYVFSDYLHFSAAVLHKPLSVVVLNTSPGRKASWQKAFNTNFPPAHKNCKTEKNISEFQKICVKLVFIFCHNNAYTVHTHTKIIKIILEIISQRVSSILQS